MTIPITKNDLRLWITEVATGEFHYTKALDGAVPRQDYGKLRSYLYDFCQGDNAICESLGRNDGHYRPIQNNSKPVNWQDIEARLDSGLILPFDLRKYAFIYPDTLIVVAGSKSSGKTAFLMQTVVLNMYTKYKRVVFLTNLEGGLSALRDRFNEMGIEIPYPAPFDLIPVDENFHDYIKDKDTIYVIDYIDAPEGVEFYMIGAALGKINNKLVGKNSVAVAGLQKPMGRDIAYGGGLTLNKATLYLALDSNKLKIVDAKVPADPKIHPKNMQWTYIFNEAGTDFLNITPYYGD